MIKKILYWHTRSNSILRAKKVSNNELLGFKYKLLIPVTNKNQINRVNLGNIQTIIISERANGSVQANADQLLEDKDIMMIFDVFAYAGSGTVCYFVRV